MIVDTVEDEVVLPHLPEIDLLHQGGDIEGNDKCVVVIFGPSMAVKYPPI